MSLDLAFDRRRFIAGTALAVAARLAFPARAYNATVPSLAFFGDRPVLDPSGTLPWWRTPAGFRGGAAIAGMSDEHLRRQGFVL